MSTKTFYAIMQADGELKHRKRTRCGTLYENRNEAIRQAKDDGDSVVRVYVTLSQEPEFIRRKVVEPT